MNNIFNVKIYFYNKNIYVFPLSKTKDNSYYHEFPPLMLKIITANDLGKIIIDSINKVRFNIDDTPLKADDFAKTFGEKNWNNFVKNAQLVLISKEQNKINELSIIPTLKYRGYWEYDYNNKKVVSTNNNTEEIGKIIMSFFNLL